MTTDPIVLHDWKLADFGTRTGELVSEGFRPLSLSQYGDPGEPLFAGVWAERPGPVLHWNLGLTVDDFLTEYRQNRIEGFHPIHVSASGGGPGARMSGFFERRDPTASAGTPRSS